MPNNLKSDLKIKICGLADAENAAAVGALVPDYIGLIFYPPSPRAVTLETAAQIRTAAPAPAIGVFVDEAAEQIIATAFAIRLSGVQLCGTTQIACARELRAQGFAETILGSFAATAENIAMLSAPDLPFDFLLFDTPSAQHGGTGQTFDWSLLHGYRGDVPFFLSGGIGSENIAQAIAFDHPRLYGLDLNSRLEIAPGIKDIQRAREAIEKIRAAR